MKLSEEQKTILKECESTSLSATDNARKLLSRHRLFMSTFNQARIQMMQECQMQLLSASCDVRDFAEKESFIKGFNISKLQNDFAKYSFKSKYVRMFLDVFKAALLSDDAADSLECVDIKFSYTDYRGRFLYETFDKKTGLDAYTGQSFTVRLFSEKLHKHIDVIIPVAKNIKFNNEDDLYSNTIGRYVVKIGAECQLNNNGYGYASFDEIDAKEIIDNDKQHIFPLTCACWKLNECKAALNEILSFDYSKDKNLLIDKLEDESTSNVVILSNECCDIVSDEQTGKFEYESYDLKRISRYEQQRFYPWETKEEDDPFAFDYHASKNGYSSLDHYMMDKFVKKLLESKPAKLVERCMEKMIKNPDSVNIKEDIIKQKEKDNQKTIKDFIVKYIDERKHEQQLQ